MNSNVTCTKLMECLDLLTTILLIVSNTLKPFFGIVNFLHTREAHQLTHSSHIHTFTVYMQPIPSVILRDTRL